MFLVRYMYRLLVDIFCFFFGLKETMFRLDYVQNDKWLDDLINYIYQRNVRVIELNYQMDVMDGCINV